MKTLTTLLLAGVLSMVFCESALAGRPAAAAVPGGELGLPQATADAGQEPKVVSLPNGLNVLIQEDDRFPLASLRLYVHAGSAYERPEEAGVSHFLEHMVFKGTQRRAPGQVARDVEGVGGYLNAATSFDYTVYYVDTPSDQWKLGLDVIQDMIFGARLDPQDLENERHVILSELERGEDSPSTSLFQTMQKLVWEGLPYGRPVIGFRETVGAVTPEGMRQYVRRFYQPRSMLLVAVGRVKEAEVLAEAQRLFGDLKNDQPLTPPAPAPAPRPKGVQVKLDKGPWNKVYLSAAFPIPGFHSAEGPALEVLAQMLGGDRASRLYRRFVYEERLADDVSVSALTLERAGMLYFSATLDADKLPTFWREFVEDLRDLNADAFGDEELARARLNIEDSMFQAKETLSGLASKVGYFQFFEGSPRAEENYLYRLSQVDKREIGRIIENYLDPASLSVAALAPAQTGAEAEDLRRTVAEAWPARPGQGLDKALASAAEAGTEYVDLGGGRLLALIPDRTLPYASVTLMWAGGDSLLSPEEQGLAELTARALTLGTKTMPATALQDYLADRASRLGASSGRESFSLSAKFPSRFSDDILGLMRQALFEPAFASEDVERAKEEQTASIRGREDQALGLAFRHLFPFLFQGVYGYYHLGEPDSLKSYTRDQVADFWRRQRGKPWVMAVCGLYERDRIVALAKAVADLGAERFEPPAPTWQADRVKDLRLAERNQLHLLLTFPVPGLRDEASPGLNLLRQVLAGQGGLLFRELRDKQSLGYSVTAFLWQAPQTGFLSFYIGTTPDKADQALAGFKQVIANLKTTPLPADELERAKNLLQGDYFRDRQSLASRGQEAASMLVKGLPAAYGQEVIDKAKTLSPEDVRRLAATLLNEDASYLMRVTP